MEVVMTTNRITEIVGAAGQIAMSLYGLERGRLKADGTWVTRADQDVETFLRKEFHSLFEASIFSEENGWTGEASAPYVIIIDPIDGTGPFRDRIPIWGVSVAIFHEGRPWLGVFSMPAANHFFLGEFGKGSQWNGKAITVPPSEIPIPTTSYLGVSSDAHHWNLRQYPGKIRAFGVSGFHVISVASGMLQAAMLTRFQFYDIAAAAIILWAAGGSLYYLSGQPVSPDDIIKSQKPTDAVLACHPDSFEETRKYIQR
jgi:fructose-1,6-bisphosphatase/inositol monophosphatase family enzyme